MACVIDEIGCTCVIAESADVAEKVVQTYGYVSHDRSPMEAYQQWENQPDPLKSRYAVYSVRVPA